MYPQYVPAVRPDGRKEGNTLQETIPTKMHKNQKDLGAAFLKKMGTQCVGFHTYRGHVPRSRTAITHRGQWLGCGFKGESADDAAPNARPAASMARCRTRSGAAVTRALHYGLRLASVIERRRYYLGVHTGASACCYAR